VLSYKFSVKVGQVFLHPEPWFQSLCNSVKYCKILHSILVISFLEQGAWGDVPCDSSGENTPHWYFYWRASDSGMSEPGSITWYGRDLSIPSLLEHFPAGTLLPLTLFLVLPRIHLDEFILESHDSQPIFIKRRRPSAPAPTDGATTLGTLPVSS
jgi:hypothetical protein